MPYLFGIGLLILFAVLYRYFCKTWNIFKLAEGADGKMSTPKFQWILWTIVALFSYVVIFVVRAKLGIFDSLIVPNNLIITMGISITTMAAAKGITVNYLNNKKITQNSATNANTQGILALFNDDDGLPDLSKIQMLAWTVIAIAVYLFQLNYQIKNSAASSLSLPDIDTTLMALMGLGQAGYLGKKIVSTNVST